jgi:hypothetical protein
MKLTKSQLKQIIKEEISGINLNEEIDSSAIRAFFTEEEWEAIDEALAEYQDQGDDEAELADSIGDKVRALFQGGV